MVHYDPYPIHELREIEKEIDTLAEKIDALVVDLSFTEDALHVVLADGREVSAPLHWFPRLLMATVEQRKQWELIGDGIGIHWPLVDEDVEIESLLATQMDFLHRKEGRLSW